MLAPVCKNPSATLPNLAGHDGTAAVDAGEGSVFGITAQTTAAEVKPPSRLLFLGASDCW